MIAIILAVLAVVNVSNNSVTYACNGVTATYQVNFPYLASTDLVVTSTTVGGSVTTLTPGTDWSVNFASTSSTATLTLANPAVKCPNTNVLLISRNRLRLQPYSFKAQSFYNQALHETAYDSLEMQIQLLDSTKFGIPGASTLSSAVVLHGPSAAPVWSAVADADITPSYSGVGSCGASTWSSALTRNSAPTCSQPAFTDLSGAASTGQIPSLDASKITTGTLPDARLTSSYSGTGSCVNQFATTLNRAAAPTCTTDVLASAQHANQGTTTTVLHGNAAGNPSFGSISLLNDVTGTLSAANGGTGTTSVANTLVFAGPTSGGPLAPTFRALAVGDLPNPSAPFQLSQADSGGSCVTTGSGTTVATLTIAVAGTYLVSGGITAVPDSGSADTVAMTINRNAVAIAGGSTTAQTVSGTGLSVPVSRTVIATFAASDVLTLKCKAGLALGVFNNFSLNVVRVAP